MNTKVKSTVAESAIEQVKATLNTKIDWSGIAWQDMEMAIGKNSHKYRKLWDRITSPEKKGPFAHLSPCWTGIPFLGVSWAISRRMYPLAGKLLAALLLIGVLFPGESEGARALGIAIVVSFTHKSTYLRWLAYCIRRIDEQGLVGTEREAALRMIGGLDLKSGCIAAAVFVALLSLSML